MKPTALAILAALLAGCGIHHHHQPAKPASQTDDGPAEERTPVKTTDDGPAVERV